MNNFSRLKKAIKFKETDVLPSLIFDQDFIVHQNNYKYRQYITSEQIMADCQIKHQKKYDTGFAIIHGDDWMEVEELGVKTVMPENESPYPVKYPITSSKQKINNLSIPNYNKKGRLQIRINAIKEIKAKLKDEIAIIAHVNAPFSMACMLLGLENAMVLIYDNKNFFTKVMDFSLKNAIECVRCQINAGANIIWVGDTFASSWLLSFEHFKDLALPYQKKIIEYIQNLGVFTIIHMHEKETKRIIQSLKTGSDIISFAHKANMKKVVKYINGECCIFGNIDPESILLKGDFAVIKDSIDYCFGLAPKSGYIIGCCDNLPRLTPEENYNFFFNYITHFPHPKQKFPLIY